MKKLSFLFVSLTVILASCGKDDEPNQIQISNQEAATYIATSLAGDEAGLQSIFTDAILVVNEVAPASGGRTSCGASDHTTFNYASQDGETPAFSFNYDYGWTLHCGNDQQPASVSINLEYDGSMASEEFSMDYDGTSQFTATNIMTDYITMNGQHNQQWTYDFDSQDQQFSGTNTYTFTLTDIVISRETSVISSGTAAVLLAGVTNRGAFSISATITYNGDGTATVSINGEAFGVDLSTGALDG